MSTTVNVVCYKSKVLKNNELPLMIRVCKDRKLIGRGAASTKG
ncbi:Arm DNA-binding domain-containing protein [Parabacteroides johnsonii]